MQPETDKTLEALSKEFSLSKEIILKKSLKFFIENKLREIKTEIFVISGKYNVSSIEDFDELYKRGKVEEKDSWIDFQNLDHLEFKKDGIIKLIHELE